MFLASLFSFSLITACSAHNWLTYPLPRVIGSDGLYGSSASESDNCGSTSTTVPDDNVFQRGDSINATWGPSLVACWLTANVFAFVIVLMFVTTVYNNHWGGFVRFTIVELGQEGNVTAVNDPANFLKISCHTGKCGGRAQSLTDSVYDYFSPYNLAAQDVAQDNSDPSLECSTFVILPDWIRDGTHVLQWSMYGVHDSDGVAAKALPFYRSCANIRVQGGTSLKAKPPGSCNFNWQGGDKSLKDPTNLDTSQCSYMMFNSINATFGYYNPDGLFTGSTEVTNPLGLRHGPPAEVLACAAYENSVSSTPHKTTAFGRSTLTSTGSKTMTPTPATSTRALLSVQTLSAIKKCRMGATRYNRFLRRVRA